MIGRLVALAGLFIASLVARPAAAFEASKYGVITKGAGWIYTRLGNQSDVAPKTTPGILFEGGGTDVGAAYQWMCQHAGGGDFLVIRQSGSADYNPYILKLCPGINSVSTLKILSREGAKEPFVAQTIGQAEALFIAGGDQSKYVQDWQKTPVSGAINALARRGVPIGGTSAGNAILAQYAFSALANTIDSAQALRNPFDFRVTIDQGFLFLSPLLTETITDDHFVTRDRMGRLVTFLARISHDRRTARPFGIALDEHTAFLMEASGEGRVVGSSSVYFISTPGRPEICRPATPLTYENLDVYRVSAGDRFDIGTWTGTGGTAYQLSADHGVLTSTQPGGGIY
jgi:cyanophycinase